MSASSKINRQNEQTWINLQKRLNEVQLFPADNAYNFIKKQAESVAISEGYLVPSLIATSAYILATNDARVDDSTHKQLLNLYTIFVGFPGTGKFPSFSHDVFNWMVRFCFHISLMSLSLKRDPARLLQFNFSFNLGSTWSNVPALLTGKSSAIKYAAQDPLDNLDMTADTISKATSSGLIKTIAANGKGFILSPEIYDILHKLMKSDMPQAMCNCCASCSRTNVPRTIIRPTRSE